MALWHPIYLCITSKITACIREYFCHDRTIKVCIYGEYNPLYDTGNKYLSKEMSEKAWKYIEANYDKLLANRDGGK